MLPSFANAKASVKWLADHCTTEELLYSIRMEESKNSFNLVEYCSTKGIVEFPTRELADTLFKVCEAAAGEQKGPFTITDLSERHSTSFKTPEKGQPSLANVILRGVLTKLQPRLSLSAEQTNPLAVFVSWISCDYANEFVEAMLIAKPKLIFVSGDARGLKWAQRSGTNTTEDSKSAEDALIREAYNSIRLTPGQVCMFDFMRKAVVRPFTPDFCGIRTSLTIYYAKELESVMKPALTHIEVDLEAKPHRYNTMWYHVDPLISQLVEVEEMLAIRPQTALKGFKKAKKDGCRDYDDILRLSNVFAQSCVPTSAMLKLVFTLTQKVKVDDETLKVTLDQCMKDVRVPTVGKVDAELHCCTQCGLYERPQKLTRFMHCEKSCRSRFCSAICMTEFHKTNSCKAVQRKKKKKASPATIKDPNHPPLPLPSAAEAPEVDPC